jgi:hypothetical protein
MKILKRLENIFSAVAFAEAGEHETARQILKENEKEMAAERNKTGTVMTEKREHISHYPSKA